ncbi:hypothetical protein [Natrinema altunense]|uniref:Uncharacterized protein n=1 Tax=Natrinema altunense (strain JCM 12890 / CGMCC 1.3731 / AJ2) TaxID=1227494 RepID=L9ZUN5_NATA2|nr:hypothetical protein [Natrinema altunense]ELY90009.1 hypothetical protein C485_03138 [Natrinema altunense JCM 12890]
MSENTDEREATDKDEHGRDVQLAREQTDPEAARDEEGLTEEEKDARERQAEAERKQDIDEGSVDREDDALENANPDHHRDEEPYNS